MSEARERCEKKINNVTLLSAAGLLSGLSVLCTERAQVCKSSAYYLGDPVSLNNMEMSWK